jgi:hypothetical protein
MRDSGSLIAARKLRDENEQLSDQHIRFRENSETLSTGQPFAEGGRPRK